MALAALDVLFYVVAARPVRIRVTAAEKSYRQVREEVGEQESRVGRLERLEASLPAAGVQVKSFLHDHVPARQWGFSTAARLVRELTQKAHVQLSSVSPKLGASKDEPLDHLALDITVDGTFPDLLNFAHAVETTSDLILVRNFSFAADEGNTLSLRMGADLYLTP